MENPPLPVSKEAIELIFHLDVELIKNNARVGASIAVKYCEQRKGQVSASGVLQRASADLIPNV